MSYSLYIYIFFVRLPWRPSSSTLFPYTTLFRSRRSRSCPVIRQTVSKIRLSCQKRKDRDPITAYRTEPEFFAEDRKSTRLNSSHRCISYAVFCLKKKIQLHGLQG